MSPGKSNYKFSILYLEGVGSKKDKGAFGTGCHRCLREAGLHHGGRLSSRGSFKSPSQRFPWMATLHEYKKDPQRKMLRKEEALSPEKRGP